MPANNETEKPQTNKAIIVIVVLALAVNGTIGVGTLSYCLIMGRELNVALLTAFVAIINFIFGAISGMLVKTSPTETTKLTEPIPPPSDAPTPVEVVNKPTDPVPTIEKP
jgi:hypothetical protein